MTIRAKPKISVPSRGSWREWARCRGAPLNLFVGPFFEHQVMKAIREENAKLVCMGCPVREPCLDEALLNHDIGVWGGTTEEERAAIQRSRTRTIFLEKDFPQTAAPPGVT